MTKEKVTATQNASKYNLVTNQITIRPVNRSPKDIADYRRAQKTAESIAAPNRVLLYDMYEDVREDGHLTGIIGKRVDTVLNKEIHFEVKGKDGKGKRVEEMNDLIESGKFRELLRLIQEKKLYGISGVEFIPGKDFDFLEMKRKHIKPDIGLYTWEQNGRDGVPYNELANFWVMGNKDDLGLLLKCSPYALYKRGGMADWAQYVEIFGMPVRIIKYDAYDEQTKIELDTVLEEAGSALAIKVPKQADFEMMDGKTSNGDGQLQERFKDALNQEMSVIILGNTETTTNGKTGTGAKSEIHQEQQLEVTKSDLKDTLTELNSKRFLEILASYGYPVQGGKFVFAKEVDRKAIQDQVGVVKTVKEMGVPVSDDYVYELTGIPKPDNYDELKQQQEEARQAITGKQPGKKKPGKEDEELEDLADITPGIWRQIRTALADFFDQAR